jgi:hypothetical protein
MTDVECTRTALRDFPCRTDGVRFAEEEFAPDNADAEGVRLFVLQ